MLSGHQLHLEYYTNPLAYPTRTIQSSSRSKFETCSAKPTSQNKEHRRKKLLCFPDRSHSLSSIYHKAQIFDASGASPLRVYSERRARGSYRSFSVRFFRRFCFHWSKPRSFPFVFFVVTALDIVIVSQHLTSCLLHSLL
jgi:hypothetical protein